MIPFLDIFRTPSRSMSQHSQVAALQALEIEVPLLAAFAGSTQALGEGRVRLQERLAGRGHVVQQWLLHG